jgi:hypothetical protein
MGFSLQCDANRDQDAGLQLFMIAKFISLQQRKDAHFIIYMYSTGGDESGNM